MNHLKVTRRGSVAASGSAQMTSIILAWVTAAMGTPPMGKTPGIEVQRGEGDRVEELAWSATGSAVRRREWQQSCRCASV
jgi:hypothetical protein